MSGSGRTPSRALEAYVAPLQRALSCVSHGVFARGQSAPNQDRFLSTGGRPLRLRGAVDTRLIVFHWFVVLPMTGARRWDIQTTGYIYELLLGEHDMFLSFHWHPRSHSPIHDPHVHVGAATPVDLSKAHVPTGVITMNQVLRFAIIDLGVEPLRDDWRDVLDSNA